jgi:PAS domain S-box-containing protein
VKFTFSGSIALTLRALPQHVELIVADTGVGIAEEEQPHLFQRFHRIAQTRGRTQQGSGIGLALVQEYASLHHGRVRVRSQVGKGTTFTIWLPLVQPARNGQRGLPAAVSPAAVTAEAQRYADEAVRWVQEETNVPAASAILDADMVDEQTLLPVFVSHARVLVVEDHADMRTYLQRLLSQHWRVQLAANGKEALSQAESHPPDLILADVMMPEMDGFALLRHVRADKHLRTIPFLLMTARAGEEAAIEGLLAGADDYLIKPFSARELLARISAQLELSRVRREGEQRVQAERQRLYDMLMQAPLSIAVVRGPDYVYELANPLTLQLLGTDRPIVGKSFLEALPEMEGQVFLNLLNSVYRTGQPFVGNEIPAQIDRNNDGTLEQRYLNFVYQPFYNADREIDRLIAFAYDVTETVLARKRAEESEERLRTLANSLPHLVWSSNAKGEIDFLNERCNEYAEMARSEEGIYQWQVIIYPDERETALREWEDVMRAEEAFEFDGRLCMKDGTYHWHLVRGIPTHDANGSLSRWYGTMTDIEQIKTHEHQESQVASPPSLHPRTRQEEIH